MRVCSTPAHGLVSEAPALRVRSRPARRMRVDRAQRHSCATLCASISGASVHMACLTTAVGAERRPAQPRMLRTYFGQLSSPTPLPAAAHRTQSQAASSSTRLAWQSLKLFRHAACFGKRRSGLWLITPLLRCAVRARWREARGASRCAGSRLRRRWHRHALSLALYA